MYEAATKATFEDKSVLSRLRREEKKNTVL